MRDHETTEWINPLAQERIRDLETENNQLRAVVSDYEYRLTKCKQRAEWHDAELRRLRTLYEIAEEL